MTLKIYCDTNVFIDYCEEREDNIRPLKDFAFLFFSKGWNCAFKLIVSDWLLEELRRHLTEEQINRVLNNFKEKDKLIMIKEAPRDRQKARGISEHWDDALHAILANKANADYLTTRNVKHYINCEKLVQVVFPEFI